MKTKLGDTASGRHKALAAVTELTAIRYVLARLDDAMYEVRNAHHELGEEENHMRAARFLVQVQALAEEIDEFRDGYTVALVGKEGT